MSQTTSQATSPVTDTPAPQLVSITPKAAAEIEKLLPDEIETLIAENPELTPEQIGLRMGVEGGGCSGFSYNLKFDARHDNDYITDMGSFKVFLDPKSAIFLKNIELDYQGGLQGKGFVFNNPNATKTCSCGESFNVKPESLAEGEAPKVVQCNTGQ